MRNRKLSAPDETPRRGGEPHRVELREFYTDYTPPRRVLKTLRKLLNRVPQQYLQGLDCVVLTNMSGQPRRLRLGKIPSSKGYVSRSRVLGLYHGAYRGKRPWIELYVDRITERYKRVLWAPFLLEGVLGDVLLHEIGHHIHATSAPEYSDKEDVAEQWKKNLFVEIGRRRHWLWRLSTRYLLFPVYKLFLLLLRACLRTWKRAANAHGAKAQPEFRASARRGGGRARR